MGTIYRKVAVSERLPPPMTDILIKYRWSNCFEPYHYFDDLHCKDEMINEVTHWIEEIPDPTSQLNAKSLEEIRDIVAKNRGYDNWEILNGSDLYDSDIDEVAKKYAEYKTAQLQADKAELLESLENLTEYGSTGEDAVEMKREIESLIQKMKKCQENTPR